MAEIDAIRRRARRRYSRFVQADEVRQAFEDRAFLVTLLDTIATEHLAEVREMERNFRSYIEAQAASRCG